MALLDVLALLDATSIYRGAIIRIGNAPATSDGLSRSNLPMGAQGRLNCVFPRVRVSAGGNRAPGTRMRGR